MKITTSSFASIFAYIGLPASFAAAALHEPAAQVATHSAPLFQNYSDFLAPLLFVSSVMSIATILVHHLREEHRLETFANLHLRLSTPKAPTLPIPVPAKARLAKVAAI